MNKISDLTMMLTRWILGIMILVLVCLVFTQVVLRFIFHSPLSWSEEVSRHLLVWLGFLGASVALEEKAHLAVDILVSHFSAKNAKAKVMFGLISRGFILITAIFMVFYGYKLFLITSHQLSSALKYPMSYVYAVIPISGLLMTLITVKDMKNYFSSLKNDI